MRNKSLVLLAIALGCGMIASVGISQVVMSGSGTAEVEMVEIFVAAQDITANSKITAENIQLEKWPAGKLNPEKVFIDIAELDDKYAKQDIYAGEPLLRQKVVDATERKTVGIPPGHTVVTYNIGNDPGIANLIEPGDRLNVIGFFEKSDIVPESTHKDVFRNVKVFAVDGRTSRTEESQSGGSPSTILLLIKQEDERVWNWANKVGQLKLTLGRPDASELDADPDAPNRAGQEFMRWLEDYAQQRRDENLTDEIEETPTNPTGGIVIQKLTKDGIRSFQWNDSTKSFRMIDEPLEQASEEEEFTPQDSFEDELPELGATPENRAFRLNRAR